MKRLQFIFALALTALPAMAKDNTPALITTVQQQDGITASLQSQFNETKQLVVNAPTHFNGMELPVSNKRKVTLTVQKSTPNDFGDEAENAWYELHRDGIPYRRYWFGADHQGSLLVSVHRRSGWRPVLCGLQSRGHAEPRRQ